MIEFLRRLLCGHVYQWERNLLSGGSAWRCALCYRTQIRSCEMPDLDALIDRMDKASNGVPIEVGPKTPPFRDLCGAIEKRFYARKAQREADEARRTGEARLAAEAKRDKERADAILGGIEQLEAEAKRLRYELEWTRKERDEARDRLKAERQPEKELATLRRLLAVIDGWRGPTNPATELLAPLFEIANEARRTLP